MAKTAKSSKGSSKDSTKAPKASKTTKAAKSTKATKATKSEKAVKAAKAEKATKSTKTAKSVKKLQKLSPVVRLAIENGSSSSGSQYGRGIASLCMGVRTLGSLNAAAKDMGMAYSKAWRIVKDTEDALGIQLLVRDGAHGSNLTDEGNLLLDVYLKINKKLNESATKEFEKAFKA